jgi:hypothetical protein
MANVSTRIEMPDGSEVDAVYRSVSNLTRMGDAQYDAVLSWVASEREKRARAAAEREQAQAERAAEIGRDAKLRAEQFERLRAERPWAFDL